MPLGGVYETRGAGEYGWWGIVAPRPLYGLARVVLGVVFPDAPTEEWPNLGKHSINGGSLPVSSVEPLLQLAW